MHRIKRAVRPFSAAAPFASPTAISSLTAISLLTAFSLLVAGSTGCGALGGADARPPEGVLELVWGRKGLADGRFQKPRALAIDNQDRLYIVDMTGRIQVFSGDGTFLRRWRTPAIKSGKPCGLSISRQGNLLVADTHYYRVLTYTPQGRLLAQQTIGGKHGYAPGEFSFVTDVAQDSQGNYFIAEYGDRDRIQMFSADRRFVLQWGGHGSEPGQFIRPQSLAVDAQDRIWVADACNHRIQVFEIRDGAAQLVKLFGEQGPGAGQLSYPYGIELDRAGHVYVCEFGNHRVQKFTVNGDSLAVWGTGGRREGELQQPWALARDSRGTLHILDTYNHRVQRIRL